MEELRIANGYQLLLGIRAARALMNGFQANNYSEELVAIAA
jgi:hypothetical protein